MFIKALKELLKREGDIKVVIKNNIPPFSRNTASSFNTEELFRSLGNIPILNGKVYTVELKADVPYTFSNKPVTGWIVVDKNKEGDVWRTGSDNKTIFISNVDIKIKIWVF